MSDNFTDRVRRVLKMANQEAHRFNQEYIGTEHILVALVKEGGGVAANALKNLEVDLDKVAVEICNLVPPGHGRFSEGKLPQTPLTKKVIEHATEEARSMNHKFVGTEHLLLGLLREHNSVAAQVLMTLGVSYLKVQLEVRFLKPDVQGGRRWKDLR